MVGLSLGGLLGVLAKTDAELPADQLVHVIACAGADLTGEAS